MADDLLPDQEEFLFKLVEAAQRVPRHEQQFTLLPGSDQGPAVVVGAGQRLEVLPDDIWVLHREGYISGQWNVDQEVPVPFTVIKAGYDLYEQRKTPTGKGAERVEGMIGEHLTGEQFRSRYPNAYQRWSEAEDMLWQSNPEDDLTTIGHKAREAMQRFATAQVDRHRPAEADPDPAKTVNRIRAVIELHRDRFGDRHREVLTALSSYWERVDGLTQRQEHGDQKGGEPLTWEDARMVVFQTASVMFEIDRWIGSSAS